MTREYFITTGECFTFIITRRRRRISRVFSKGFRERTPLFHNVHVITLRQFIHVVQVMRRKRPPKGFEYDLCCYVYFVFSVRNVRWTSIKIKCRFLTNFLLITYWRTITLSNMQGLSFKKQHTSKMLSLWLTLQKQEIWLCRFYIVALLSEAFMLSLGVQPATTIELLRATVSSKTQGTRRLSAIMIAR